MHIRSFKNKLFIFFILILVIQTAITGFLYYRISVQSLEEKINNSYESIVESTGENMNSTLERLEWYMTSLLTNSSLQSLLKETDFQNSGGELYESMAEASMLIENMFYNEKKIMSCYLVPINQEKVYTLLNKYYLDLDDNEDLLQYSQTLKLKGKINWMGFIEKSGQRYFVVSRLLSDVTTLAPRHNPLAVIYLFFSEDILSHELIGNNLEPDSSLALLNENMDILSYKGEKLSYENSIINSLSSKMTEDYGRFEHMVNDDKVLVFYYSLNYVPWKVAYIIPQTNVALQYKYILSSGILLFLFLLLGFGIVSYILSSSIARPLKALSNGFKELESGNFNTIVKHSSEDEVGMIIVGFHRMAERISSLFKKAIEEERLKREYEIRSLQYQINPHFLFNTLNSVRLMSIMSKNLKITDVLDTLIKFLRNVLGDNNALISLAGEMENIRLYIYIENIRYNGMIKTKFNIDENVTNFRIPNFILQPIVENAIFHGIAPQETGTLIIEASRKEDILSISISDSGIGMTKEKISKLIGISDDNSHIGLINVDRRIKLHFGDAYGLTIESELGKGTTVTAKLPLVKDGKE